MSSNSLVMSVAVCKIHVGEISDHVKSWGGSSSVTSLNGYKFVSFGVSISNKLASSITLTGMKMTDVSTGSTIVNYTFKESDATIASGESKTFSASKNGTYVSYFGFIITYTYNGATYTTECSYNFDK